MAENRSPRQAESEEDAAAAAWFGADLARLCVLAEDAPARWWENPSVYVPALQLMNLFDSLVETERARRRQMRGPS